MKKVFQTIIDKEHGNCQQAAVASLLECELEEVPNFIENRGHESLSFMNWFYNKGHSPCFIYRKKYDIDFLKKITAFDGGYNGYFYASVPSQTYEGISHAVIVDTDLNIIHDPNPNQLCLNLKPEDVESILVLKDAVIGKTWKLFTKEEWDNTTQEERDINTWKVIYDENGNVIGSE